MVLNGVRCIIKNYLMHDLYIKFKKYYHLSIVLRFYIGDDYG